MYTDACFFKIRNFESWSASWYFPHSSHFPLFSQGCPSRLVYLMFLNLLLSTVHLLHVFSKRTHLFFQTARVKAVQSDFLSVTFALAQRSICVIRDILAIHMPALFNIRDRIFSIYPFMFLHLSPFPFILTSGHLFWLVIERKLLG